MTHQAIPVQQLLNALQKGDKRALARAISIVENDGEGCQWLLENLNPSKAVPVIGITGPPGAGKSTLVSQLASWFNKNKNYKVAILAVDPTSPFTQGSLLGDRLRMNEHFNNPSVYIRSLATRGALGGLSAKTIEISDLLKSADFDLILIETVGVGQSEVEIASLADTTIVVFVPESGDEIQTLKSGIMEIGDLFVVNKSDREGADRLVRSIQTTLHERPYQGWTVPVLKTIAMSGEGIGAVAEAILDHHSFVSATNDKKQRLLYQRAVRLLIQQLVKKQDLKELQQKLTTASEMPGFNLYRFLAEYQK